MYVGPVHVQRVVLPDVCDVVNQYSRLLLLMTPHQALVFSGFFQITLLALLSQTYNIRFAFFFNFVDVFVLLFRLR